MKRVMLRDRGQFKAREVIQTILEQPSPGQGVTYADMRKRDRVQEAIDKQKGQTYVDLEDADHALLYQLLDAFQFGVARRELRQILDDIANAKPPEETVVLGVVKEN